jgi:hypothetical protein
MIAMLDTTQHRRPFPANSHKVRSVAISVFITGSFVGFVVDNVALGRVGLSVLRCSPVSTIPAMLHIHPSINDQRQIDVAVKSIVQYDA